MRLCSCARFDPYGGKGYNNCHQKYTMHLYLIHPSPSDRNIGEWPVQTGLPMELTAYPARAKNSMDALPWNVE